MAKEFTKDDIPKVEDLWFNFIKKVRDLGLDFSENHVILEMKVRGTSDHSVHNRLELQFDNNHRETSMKVTHNVRDKPKEEDEE
jgi:hypothetical protein